MAIPTMGVVVLDCPDTGRLADFYARMLGWKVDESRSDRTWTEVVDESGRRRLAFQEAPGLVPPEWPSGEHSQQFHLDLDVPPARIDEAEREVLALGARLLQDDGGGERGFRVYLDPAGHPFCLCLVDR
ncbi:VOC family protein [Streptomyces reniochalinae]|uniref:VOC family protein n=1 Tax=Streptomyces reniochalinae TaxID=2250578 RepID=A0A367F169_9ACTN|nr:VOC family protein [Streptomyces reniochalinae]RCG23220.1 VOC family protein [Streptomyces reniochalinae]